MVINRLIIASTGLFRWLISGKGHDNFSVWWTTVRMPMYRPFGRWRTQPQPMNMTSWLCALCLFTNTLVGRISKLVAPAISRSHFFCNATVFACFCTMPRCSEMWSLQVCQHEHPQVQQMRFQLQSLLWFSNGSLTKNWLGPLVVDDVGSWNDGTWLFQPIINRRPRPGRNMSSSE